MTRADWEASPLHGVPADGDRGAARGLATLTRVRAGLLAAVLAAALTATADARPRLAARTLPDGRVTREADRASSTSSASSCAGATGSAPPGGPTATPTPGTLHDPRPRRAPAASAAPCSAARASSSPARSPPATSAATWCRTRWPAAPRRPRRARRPSACETLRWPSTACVYGGPDAAFTPGHRLRARRRHRRRPVRHHARRPGGRAASSWSRPTATSPAADTVLDDLLAALGRRAAARRGPVPRARLPARPRRRASTTRRSTCVRPAAPASSALTPRRPRPGRPPRRGRRGRSGTAVARGQGLRRHRAARPRTTPRSASPGASRCPDLAAATVDQASALRLSA